MNLRQFVSENFAGDLEYHPRRGALYLLLGVAGLAGWWLIPSERYADIRLVLGVGAIPFLIKGVFFFRKSSEGLGLSYQEQEVLVASTRQKGLGSLPALAARFCKTSLRDQCFFAIRYSLDLI